MLDFKPITPGHREAYEALLRQDDLRGCEYSFSNLYLWGRQKLAFFQGQALLFSQFNRRSVYPFPVGPGSKAAALEAICEDARARGIPCRITGMNEADKALLEALYPGKFHFHCDRDAYDYVYAIDDLADLKGRKYQKKRNHINRFRQDFPQYEAEPLSPQTLPRVQALAELWYDRRSREDPSGDYAMERSALKKALAHCSELGMEGLVLREGEDILAFTLGSFLRPDMMDIHFEKAHPDAQGAYPAINWEFARYLRSRHPQLRFLNREDDMGLEGLRRAKESYYPHRMIEKCWACAREDGYDY